jgi:tetratricopeptide (TPR) repeat protein
MPPDWDRARAFAQSAVSMAQRLEKPVVLSRALGALASVLDGESRLRDHLDIATKRLEIARDGGVDDPVEQIDAVSGAGLALMYVGEYAQAMPHLDEAARLAASVRSIGQQVAALQVKAQCLFRLDRWDDVLEIDRQFREMETQFSRQQMGPT